MKKKYSQNEKRILGFDQNISRKDFLKGSLLGSGALLLNMQAPAFSGKALNTIQGQDWNGYQGIGDYANSNGNTWEVISDAHKIRDNLIPDKTNSISEEYDMVIIGPDTGKDAAVDSSGRRIQPLARLRPSAVQTRRGRYAPRLRRSAAAVRNSRRRPAR